LNWETGIFFMCELIESDFSPIGSRVKMGTTTF
jgi:hypothetical protein